jgi:hypothetical protein
MGKFATYLLVMTGIMLVFYFMGLVQNTPDAKLLDILLKPTDIENSQLTKNLIIMLGVVVTISAVALTKFFPNAELFIKRAFLIYLISLGWDFLSVVSVVYNINPVIAILIFGPTLFVYILTVAEWYFHQD